jgi:hypothetical protein
MNGIAGEKPGKRFAFNPLPDAIDVDNYARYGRKPVER